MHCREAETSGGHRATAKQLYAVIMCNVYVFLYIYIYIKSSIYILLYYNCII